MIEITKIVQPESGAIMLIRCPECACTEIVLSEYACKPEKGDAWKVTFPCLKHTSIPKFQFNI